MLNFFKNMYLEESSFKIFIQKFKTVESVSHNGIGLHKPTETEADVATERASPTNQYNYFVSSIGVTSSEHI